MKRFVNMYLLILKKGNDFDKVFIMGSTSPTRQRREY